MAESTGSTSAKKRILIDITSDSVCPWCFVGKKNLDKAIAQCDKRFSFEIRWHPFFLDPSAPREGVNKSQYYRNKFGARADGIIQRMTQIFNSLGLDYNIDGLTGNTMDSHRLIRFAGLKDLSKQHELVEELFVGYFTQARYIGDRAFLVECAQNVGLHGAEEYLEDPNNGAEDINDELRRFSNGITGVPHFTINLEHKLSGAQTSEAFIRIFEGA